MASSPPRLTVVLAVVLCAPSQGCFSLLGDIQAGYVSSTTLDTERMGGGLNLSGGGNINETDQSAEHFGPGLALRTKFASSLQQFALSPHVYYLHGSWVSPYLRAGANLLQLEHVDDGFGYGMFSPYGELGMYITPFVMSGFVEYDVRFTEQPNEGYFGFMIGIGTGLSTDPLTSD
jgi:hypothetical protein